MSLIRVSLNPHKCDKPIYTVKYGAHKNHRSSVPVESEDAVATGVVMDCKSKNITAWGIWRNPCSCIDDVAEVDATLMMGLFARWCRDVLLSDSARISHVPMSLEWTNVGLCEFQGLDKQSSLQIAEAYQQVLQSIDVQITNNPIHWVFNRDFMSSVHSGRIKARNFDANFRLLCKKWKAFAP